MVLPDVISASLSQDAWACIPVGRRVLVPVASPAASAFPKSRLWVGFPRRSAERDFTAAGVSRSLPFLTFRPPGLFATQVSPTAAAARLRGSRDFFTRAEHGSSPTRASGMLAVRTRQLTAEDSHLLDLQPCRPLPGLSPAGPHQEVSAVSLLAHRIPLLQALPGATKFPSKYDRLREVHLTQ